MRKCKTKGYEHRQRLRSTTGFFCQDCREFFPRESATYRRLELSMRVSFVLRNLNIELRQLGKESDEEVADLEEALFSAAEGPENYEELLAAATVLMEKYGKNEDSSTLVLPMKGMTVAESNALAEEREKVRRGG